MKSEKLTDKQKIFCQEYVIDWNATRAAKAAGYSEKTASVIGMENLTKPYIQAYIDEVKNNIEQLAQISKLKLIKEHAKIAFSSIANMHNTWIKLKEFEELTEDQKECIQEINTKTVIRATENGKQIEDIYVKIKLYDKQKSIDAISKMMGYDAPTNINLSGTVQTVTVTPEEASEIDKAIEEKY